MKSTVSAIVTIPPYATFIKEVTKHTAVSGLRLNTVMPVKSGEGIEEMLKRLSGITQKYGKELWIDLKARQLRVEGYASPPYTEIILSHKITVDTPITAYFSNGLESGKVLAAEGKKLIMEDGPRRVVGPGESVNIPHDSLKIEGFLTDTDKKYVDASMKLGLHKYMLSFVEDASDVSKLKEIDSLAEVVAKIESRKGLSYVNLDWDGEARLMAARGDLYIELAKPHEIIRAVSDILAKDKNAILASRIFPSFASSLEPSCQDIGDVDNLMRMGYKTFMLGDEVCQRRESVLSSLNLFREMASSYNF